MAVMQERRKRARGPFAGRVQVSCAREARSVDPHTNMVGVGVNLSEGGMCLRLKEALEVSARVQLRLFAQAKKRPLTCAGRVAWVVQRLDLRTRAPFVYDVGVEFVKPPLMVRQVVGTLARPVIRPALANGRAPLEPAVVGERRYLPSLQREPGAGEPWHLVVRVDGVPCFAKRFASQRAAFQAWGVFQRHMNIREAR